MPPRPPAESPPDPHAATVSEADPASLRTMAGGGALEGTVSTWRKPVTAVGRRCRAPPGVAPPSPMPLGWSRGDRGGATQTPLPVPMAPGLAVQVYMWLGQQRADSSEHVVGLGGAGAAACFFWSLSERYYGLSMGLSSSECQVGLHVGLVLLEDAPRGSSEKIYDR